MNKFLKVMICIILAMEIIYTIASAIQGYIDYNDIFFYGWGRCIINILLYISVITCFKRKGE